MASVVRFTLTDMTQESVLMVLSRKRYVQCHWTCLTLNLVQVGIHLFFLLDTPHMQRPLTKTKKCSGFSVA